MKDINNYIKEKYWIRLLTCPNCGKVLSTYDIKSTSEWEYICYICWEIQEPHCFPDLFY